MNTKLKTNIEKQLSARNLSVSELERRAGLKQSTLQNILYGRSKNPSIETVSLIAKELNCSIEELMGELNVYHSEVPVSKIDAVVEEPYWNATLYIKAIEVIQTILDAKKLNLSKKQILASVDEVYKYSMGVSEEIDKRFAEWMIDKML